MATTNVTLDTSNISHRLATWAALTHADTGKSVSMSEFPDRTVQVFGTFGSGTVTLQGSNDAGETTWSTLHDFQGNLLTLTDGSVKLIAENPLRIRPVGSGSGMSVSVVIVGNK